MISYIVRDSGIQLQLFGMLLKAKILKNKPNPIPKISSETEYSKVILLRLSKI